MPYSQLVYRDLRPDRSPSRATIVTVHGNQGELNDLVPLAQALGSDLRVVAPEAARGVYYVREVVAHAWYGGWQVEHPEPASFGDSLAQLERFLHDVRERAGEGEPAPPWLLGYDQGAVLALSLAAVVPDLIAGVMAIHGCLPSLPDPDLLAPLPSHLPILLIGDRADAHPPQSAIAATEARLAARGARLTTAWIDGACQLGPSVAETVRTWFDGQIGR